MNRGSKSKIWWYIWHVLKVASKVNHQTSGSPVDHFVQSSRVVRLINSTYALYTRLHLSFFFLFFFNCLFWIDYIFLFLLFLFTNLVTSGCCPPTSSTGAYGQSWFISVTLEKKTMLVIFIFSLTILVEEFKFPWIGKGFHHNFNFRHDL
jgi:hypothetical protein